ncbi:MAG: hypothetical protein J6Y62_05365 [Clostridia bacterium]|nr:hypothetical protein [Clostridia bacterium]
MDYKKIYEKFIDSRRQRKIEKGEYYEIHHISPRCLNGGNKEKNLIRLTFREHYFAHLLLYKIYENVPIIRNKMIHCLSAMNCCNQYEKRNEFTWRSKNVFKKMTKKELSESMTGEGNPFYGKKHTEETKNKIIETIKKHGGRKGKKNANYGHKWSEELKREVSLKKKQWFNEHPEFNPKDVSDETKDKIRQTKLGTKNPNSKICKLIFPDGTEKIVESPLSENMKKIGVSYQSFRYHYIDKSTSINFKGIKMVIIARKGREKDEFSDSRKIQ